MIKPIREDLIKFFKSNKCFDKKRRNEAVDKLMKDIKKEVNNENANTN